MGGDRFPDPGLRGQDIFEAEKGRGPEFGPPRLVELFDVAVLIPRPIDESLAGMLAMAKVVDGGVVEWRIDRFVVDLPHGDRQMLSVAFDHGPDQLFGVRPVMGVVFADVGSGAVFGIKSSVLGDRLAIGILPVEPAGDLRSWEAKQDLQTDLFAQVECPIKVVKTVLSRFRLDPIPGHLAETDGIEPALFDLLEGLFPRSQGPLVGVESYAERIHSSHIVAKL